MEITKSGSQLSARVPADWLTGESRRSEIEIRPFYGAADLAGVHDLEELSVPRDGERGKLGVA